MVFVVVHHTHPLHRSICALLHPSFIRDCPRDLEAVVGIRWHFLSVSYDGAEQPLNDFGGGEESLLLDLTTCEGH